MWHRFRAKKEQLKKIEGLSPESQGQNLAVKVLCVPRLLDNGRDNGWQTIQVGQRPGGGLRLHQVIWCPHSIHLDLDSVHTPRCIQHLIIFTKEPRLNEADLARINRGGSQPQKTVGQYCVEAGSSRGKKGLQLLEAKRLEASSVRRKDLQGYLTYKKTHPPRTLP